MELFQPTAADLRNANPLFRPKATKSGVLAASSTPPTNVWITTPNGVEVDLVATFAPVTPAANGVRRVAGLQAVTATVMIPFAGALPLYWIASARRSGDISPNEAFFPYSSAGDSFSLTLNPAITVSYGGGAWKIPAFDSTEYSVEVGFGLGNTFICWAYSATGYPQTSISMQASAYELVRSNGSEQIGDPVASNPGDWVMPIGYDYTLAFDSSGNGVLTKV